MTGPATGVAPAGFKDRSAWLVVFGIVEILLGGLCALMVPAYLAIVALEGAGPGVGGPASLRTAIPSLSFYLLLAVVFVWLGIGSLLARRWARTLMLMVSWIWLLCGVVVMAAFVLFAPVLIDLLTFDASGSATLTWAAMAIVTGLLAVLYVVLPGVFVLFYRSPSVQATCEMRDPRTAWTERCPQPVLALSLSHALLAWFLLGMVAYDWAVPVFGVVWSGWRGAAVVLVCVGWCLYLAWGTYKLRVGAWWLAMALAIATTVSAVVTFRRVGEMAWYAAMGLPPEQLALLREILETRSWVTSASLVVFGAAWVAYLLRVARYFRGDGAAGPTAGA
jgi:hypothetical protein